MADVERKDDLVRENGNESPEERILNDALWNEYVTSKENRRVEYAEFEANLDMVECKRTEKNEDWLSDIFIPEAPTIFLVQAAQEAIQYFSTRDFVDVYLEGSSPQELLMCKSVKKIINHQLNNRRTSHFIKYMQAREINRLIGYVYAVCWWEQEVTNEQVGVNTYPIAHEDELHPGSYISEMREEPIYRPKVKKDCFNWCPVDPRNVFSGNTYTYSAQDEPFVIFRSERTIDQLKNSAKDNQYINLDQLDKLRDNTDETDTSKETFNQIDQFRQPDSYRSRFDILERYGRQWAIVKERDDGGYPTSILPGYDSMGKILPDSEFIHVRQTIAYKGGFRVLIRFQPEPLRDSDGDPYIPVIRGIRFVHATKKNGSSDAHLLRESQIALNDTFNIAQDRTMLATIPVFKVNRGMAEDNDTIFMEPGHKMLMDDINQIEELKIRDNIPGAIQQMGMLRQSMHQVASVFPHDMGDQGKSEVTATAIADASASAGGRKAYANLSFEYTFLTELYWIMLQMTYQFMRPETARSILSDQEILAFNPSKNYSFQPVSSALEAEVTKDKKIQRYDQVIGRLSGLAQANPAIIPVIAHCVGQILEILGGEFREVEGMISNLMRTPMQQEGGDKQGADNGNEPLPKPESPKDAQSAMTQNQYGLPVSAMEESARDNSQR